MDAVRTDDVKEHVAACIGMGEMDRARLRLLLRLAGQQLGGRWRLRPDDVEHADILFVAADAEYGQMAATRARGTGVRCIVVGGPSGREDVLPLPLELDDLVAVLDHKAPRPHDELSLIAPSSLEFFQSVPERDASQTFLEPTDFDALYPRKIPGVDDRPVFPKMKTDATGQPVGEGVPGTAPTTRARAEANPFMRPDDPAPPAKAWNLQPANKFSRGRSSGEGSGSSLEGGPPKMFSDYLRDNALIGPSRLELPGCAPLIVDPKSQTYYIEGDLLAAEPYLGRKFRSSDWRPATNTLLRREREAGREQPLERLRWLDGLRSANGWLPKHLDPGGTYRVKQLLELGPEFEAERRIGEVLLRPHRLHDVVTEADVTMPLVFDVVAAYDAIGLLEWTPRERFR